MRISAIVVRSPQWKTELKRGSPKFSVTRLAHYSTATGQISEYGDSICVINDLTAEVAFAALLPTGMKREEMGRTFIMPPSRFPVFLRVLFQSSDQWMLAIRLRNFEPMPTS